MRVTLAGVAGVGKTTIARILERDYGLQYTPVEAEECWPLEGCERQRCFLEVFADTIRNGVGVLDNSLLSVYAYSKALNCLEVAGEALRLWERLERRTVVLMAAPSILASRIKRRLAEEPRRTLNVLEQGQGRLRVHIAAQGVLLVQAVGKRLPIVWTHGDPAWLAGKVRSLLTW